MPRRVLVSCALAFFAMLLSVSSVRAQVFRAYLSASLTLARSRRQHALVADYDPAGHPTIRGIFAGAQIARQHGREQQTGEIAHGFAEIKLP
jgi:hypothetical protein